MLCQWSLLIFLGGLGGLESEGEEEEPLEFGHLLHFQQKRLIAHGREW